MAKDKQKTEEELIKSIQDLTEEEKEQRLVQDALRRNRRHRFRSQLLQTGSEYEEADVTNKQNLGRVMSERMFRGDTSGQAIKNAIKEKIAAKGKSISKMWDPINLLSKVPGIGSGLATAYGMKTGRSASDISYFTGAGRFLRSDKEFNGSAPAEKLSKIPASENTGSLSTTVTSVKTPAGALKKIYTLLNKWYKEDKKWRDDLKSTKEIADNFKEEQDAERHRELIKSLTGKQSKGTGYFANKKPDDKEGSMIPDWAKDAAKIGGGAAAGSWLSKNWKKFTKSPMLKKGAKFVAKNKSLFGKLGAGELLGDLLAPEVMIPITIGLAIAESNIRKQEKLKGLVAKGNRDEVKAELRKKYVSAFGPRGKNGAQLSEDDEKKLETETDKTMEKFKPATGNRGEKNNNPGNLKFGDFAKAHGATGQDDKGFAIFPDRDAGEKAQRARLFEKGTGKIDYSGMTLDKAIETYAPPSENDTATYQKNVSKSLGSHYDPNKKLSEYSKEDQDTILKAFQKQEGTYSSVELSQAKPVSQPNQLAVRANQAVNENQNLTGNASKQVIPPIAISNVTNNVAKGGGATQIATGPTSIRNDDPTLLRSQYWNVRPV